MVNWLKIDENLINYITFDLCPLHILLYMTSRIIDL